MGLFKKDKPGQTIELRVTGMTCNHCEMRVAKALEAVPGVKDAQADHNQQKAVLTVQGDVAMADLIAAVDTAGYTAEPSE
jgi:copper chaperone CopZ